MKESVGYVMPAGSFLFLPRMTRDVIESQYNGGTVNRKEANVSNAIIGLAYTILLCKAKAIMPFACEETER